VILLATEFPLELDDWWVPLIRPPLLRARSAW